MVDKSTWTTQPSIPPTNINTVKLYYICISYIPTGLKLMLIYVKFILSPIGDNRIVSLSDSFVHNNS